MRRRAVLLASLSLLLASGCTPPWSRTVVNPPSQGRGGVRLPFPFQPEWVMEALGMADRDQNGTFEPVKASRDTFELVQNTTGPQGQPVRKVTIFSRTQSLQVMGHRLDEASGKEICTAQILERRYDQASQVVVPRQVRLSWPGQQLTMKLRLDDMRVNG